jgi:hypothetical protein
VLALGSACLLLLVLLAQLALPRAWRAFVAWRHSRRGLVTVNSYDPGRELRAEQKARELLRSCLNEEEWAMYRDLGFLRIWGGLSGRPEAPSCTQRTPLESAAEADYAYLVYPHRPIVAFLPQTGALLNEYCVAFPDRSKPYGSERLPASDDVLAKWMALRADERHLISEANMHLPGRQVDPSMLRRDVRRLARWERERLGESARRSAPQQEQQR